MAVLNSTFMTKIIARAMHTYLGKSAGRKTLRSQKTQHGQTLAPRANPCGLDPLANPGLYNRAILSFLSKFWKNNMSALDRTAWDNFSSVNTLRNEFNVPVVMGGWQCFIWYHCHNFDFMQTAIQFAPGAYFMPKKQPPSPWAPPSGIGAPTFTGSDDCLSTFYVTVPSAFAVDGFTMTGENFYPTARGNTILTRQRVNSPGFYFFSGLLMFTTIYLGLTGRPLSWWQAHPLLARARSPYPDLCLSDPISILIP